ncbi:DUF7575 domain-containing protein [Halobellus sp. GM3]|uniref:DUF7575 domain-containing protein n=1 Tax=Halobellus sp. GM3 TaxID=3458410 RepID=UPI00403D8208
MDSQRSKRPWLAALLATLATGLGHVYLRRWKRGLGWFTAAVAVSVLFVPPEATQELFSGGGNPVALAPALAVGVASVADAYVLARSQQRRARATAGRARQSGLERDPADVGNGQSPVDAEISPADDDAGPAAAVTVGSSAPTGASDCPHCGKELDPDLDFCPWCTTRLTDASDR